MIYLYHLSQQFFFLEFILKKKIIVLYNLCIDIHLALSVNLETIVTNNNLHKSKVYVLTLLTLFKLHINPYTTSMRLILFPQITEIRAICLISCNREVVEPAWRFSGWLINLNQDKSNSKLLLRWEEVRWRRRREKP